MSATTWVLDSLHSSAEFELSHMSVSTYRGRFRVMTASLVLDEANPAQSKVSAEVEVRSIDVEPGPLLDRLLAEEFFDAAKHPTLRFESTRVEPTAPNRFRATGRLSIRGVEREVTFDFETLGTATHPFVQKPMKAFRGKATIDRGEFGMKWNAPLDTGAAYLGEQVSLTLNTEFLRQDGEK